MEKLSRNEEIRTKYNSGRTTLCDLGKEYGISRQRIHQIVSGKKYGGNKSEEYINNTIKKRGIKIPKINETKEFIENFLLKKAFDNASERPIFDNLGVTNVSELTGVPHGGRDRFRQLIRLRDNFKCQWCLKKWRIGERALDVHHIVGDGEDTKKTSGNPFEMITLCHKCHLNIDSWKMKKQHSKMAV